jgi:hypothetical protein
MVLDAQLAAAAMPPKAAPMRVAPPARVRAPAVGSFEPARMTPWLLAAGVAGVAWAVFKRKRRAQ